MAMGHYCSESTYEWTLQTWQRSRTAIDVARELLMSFENSLGLLSMRDALELSDTAGIGKVKAVTLAAAFEIGRRTQSLPGNDAPLLNNPEAVHRFIMRDFAGEKREVFKVIALSTSGKVKRVKTLTEGTLSASLVDARAVFKFAILEDAAEAGISVHYERRQDLPQACIGALDLRFRRSFYGVVSECR